MDFPPLHMSLATIALLSAAILSTSSVSSFQIGCEQLCFTRAEPLPPHCTCNNQGDADAIALDDLQRILKKAAPHNKIFKWGRKRSIDEGSTDGAGDTAYAPQTVQRRIFRWGKRSAPIQNQIFRWGKKRTGQLVDRSAMPGYGDLSSTDVLRLEEAIRQGRMDYYDVLAGSDVPVGKRRNMNPELQNHIFKWGKRAAGGEGGTLLRQPYAGDKDVPHSWEE